MQQHFGSSTYYVSALEQRSDILDELVAESMAHIDNTLAIDGISVCSLFQPQQQDAFETTWEELLK